MLHYAAHGGFNKEVDILIEKGPDVQALDAKSVSPLHYAAYGGHCRISQALLKAGASVRSLTSFLQTPLHYPAQNGRIDVIKMLIDCGADVMAEDLGGFTSFGRASPANYTAAPLIEKR